MLTLSTKSTTVTPKSKQKNLEDVILKKSSRFTKSSATDSTTTADSTGSEITEPPLPKKRKPRHHSEEGKKFLKAKAKARALEEGPPPPLPKSQKGKRSAEETTTTEQDAEPPRKKSKKGKKKRKKSKGQEVNGVKEKRPETEERQRNESLAYLQLFIKHKDHWKFEKLKQMWLLKNANKVQDIDDKVFKMLLEYISSVKGAAKVKTLQEMQEFMAAFEKKYGREGGDPNSVFSNFKPEKSLEEAGEDERKEYDRATQIVNILSDN